MQFICCCFLKVAAVVVYIIASATLYKVCKFLTSCGIDLDVSVSVSILMNVLGFWILLILHFLPLSDCLYASPCNLFSYVTSWLKIILFVFMSTNQYIYILPAKLSVYPINMLYIPLSFRFSHLASIIFHYSHLSKGVKNWLYLGILP